MLWFENAWSEREKQQNPNQCQALSLTDSRKLMGKPGLRSLNSPLPPRIRALFIQTQTAFLDILQIVSQIYSKISPWNPQRRLSSMLCYCWTSHEMSDPSHWVGEMALCTWWSTRGKLHPFLPQLCLKKSRRGSEPWLPGQCIKTLISIVYSNPYCGHTIISHSTAHLNVCN